MIRPFRSVAVQAEMKNQKSRQVHQDIQRIRYGAGTNTGQDPFEKDREYSQGQQAVGNRKSCLKATTVQPVNREREAENQGQAKEIVAVVPDPAGRRTVRLAQADQKKNRHQSGQKTVAPG